MAAKVLITGGAGYIGSVLVQELLNQGFNVVVLDNFMFNQHTLLEHCINPNFEVIFGDCRDKGTLQRALKGVDIIIPLAALVGAPLCNKDKIATVSTNLDAIKLLMELRSAEQIVLYPCTNSGYGVGEKDKYCTEESPLRPISLYGTTKVEAETAVLQAGNSITFRLATVFGLSPRPRLDLLVNDFVYRAVTDRVVTVFEGHFKRNYIHVRDVVRAFIHGINNFRTMEGHPYNVGLSDANLSKLELCAKIKGHIPHFVYMEAPVGEDPDKRDYIVSNEKIERTGYKPQYSLDDGIRELIKGYSYLRNSRYTNV